MILLFINISFNQLLYQVPLMSIKRKTRSSLFYLFFFFCWELSFTEFLFISFSTILSSLNVLLPDIHPQIQILNSLTNTAAQIWLTSNWLLVQTMLYQPISVQKLILNTRNKVCSVRLVSLDFQLLILVF